MIPPIGILEPGDLIFTKSNSILSWSIRKMTSSKWSHVVVYIGKGCCIESDIGGVSIVPLPHVIVDSDLEVIPLPKRIDRDEFLERLWARVGDGYDYGLFLWNILKRMCSSLSKYMGRMDGSSKWMCSEIVAKALTESGETFTIDPKEMIPDNLYNFYKAEMYDGIDD